MDTPIEETYFNYVKSCRFLTNESVEECRDDDEKTKSEKAMSIGEHRVMAPHTAELLAVSAAPDPRHLDCPKRPRHTAHSDAIVRPCGPLLLLSGVVVIALLSLRGASLVSDMKVVVVLLGWLWPGDDTSRFTFPLLTVIHCIRFMHALRRGLRR
jgi:hypothetical protein